MTTLTIHCPKCNHTHEVEAESVWDELGLLVTYDEWKLRRHTLAIEPEDMPDTFLKEREG